MIVVLAAAAFACGAVSRPGVAEYGADGIWRGEAVEACRTLAEGAPIAFRGYDTRAALLDAVRDRVAFVSASEAAAAGLVAGPRIATERQVLVVASASPISHPDQAAEAAAAGLVAGPRIATERQVLIVRPASPLARVDDAAGRIVCFIIGTRAEDALGDRPVTRLGFQEPDEMADGLTSGKCAALAVDVADDVEPAHRTLAPPLAETPVIAATPPGAPAWTARVAAMLAKRR